MAAAVCWLAAGSQDRKVSCKRKLQLGMEPRKRGRRRGTSLNPSQPLGVEKAWLQILER